MELDALLKDNDIDLPALEQIKHRVFVVGRFTQRDAQSPALYLFTNRRDLNDRYRKNFKDVRQLTYDEFVEAVRPVLPERFKAAGRFDAPRQVIPGPDDSDEGSVVDRFNYFFQRAVSNPEQVAFRSAQPDLPGELLRGTTQESGKAIFRTLRRHLATFSAFQPRTYELVDCLADNVTI